MVIWRVRLGAALALCILGQDYLAAAPTRPHSGKAHAHLHRPPAPLAPLSFDMPADVRAVSQTPSISGDKAVHVGDVTITPGGFLEIGTQAPAGR